MNIASRALGKRLRKAEFYKKEQTTLEQACANYSVCELLAKLLTTYYEGGK